MSKTKLCKRGHERTPDNINHAGACRICNKMSPTQKRAFDRKQLPLTRSEAGQAVFSKPIGEVKPDPKPVAKKTKPHAPRGERPTLAKMPIAGPPSGEPSPVTAMIYFANAVGEAGRANANKPTITPSDVLSVKPSADEKTLAEFHTLTRALGKDPQAMLAECARAWLNAVHAAIASIDGDDSGERLPPDIDGDLAAHVEDDDEEHPFKPGNVEEVHAAGSR